MKKLTITLQQHTPLIHFQYDQQGATLRASEVKPRFDKFIISNGLHAKEFDYWKSFLVGGISFSESQLKEKSPKEIEALNRYKDKREQDLLVKFNNGFCALDYEMRIRPLNVSGKKVIKANELDLCLYFGNQGEGEDKHAVLYYQDILLEVTSHHAELITILEDRISSFLERTNFGTRQTKGYGCFFIKEKFPTEANYYFEIETAKMEELFASIADFYNVLRAGINNKKLYVKSALFKYLKEVKGQQWDKKTIKQSYYTPTEKNEELTGHAAQSNDQKEAILYTVVPPCNIIFKELLGLSTSETWRRPAANVTHKLSRVHVETIEDKSIKRFKSPILLKPIFVEKQNGVEAHYNVYIYLSDIPQEMRNQKFRINWDRRSTLHMTTSSDFDLSEYFEWIYLNRGTFLSDLLGAANGNEAKERYNNINHIFNQLKRGI